MKKIRFIAFAVFLLSGMLSSCIHHGNHVNIAIIDNEDEYSLKAVFNPNKTKAIQHYLKNQLGANEGFYTTNMFDEEVSIDADNSVYVKCTRGHLKVNFDKEENSYEAYEKVKNMCADLKEIITHH
ncbi:MAG: hypothetical protein IPP48_10000 [Chitinophagaceae bacterium]|nr:hypothetical protein [Chitinophagaceae bacterium]